MSDRLEVELDVFSGMPNPRWPLPRSAMARIAAWLGTGAVLPPTTEPGDLGYRGFIVRWRDADGACRMRVFDGILWITRGATTEHRRDPGRAAERWLLDSAGPALDAELAEMVRDSIDG